MCCMRLVRENKVHVFVSNTVNKDLIQSVWKGSLAILALEHEN